MGAIQKVRTLEIRQFSTPLPPCTIWYAFEVPLPLSSFSSLA